LELTVPLKVGHSRVEEFRFRRWVFSWCLAANAVEVGEAIRSG
jgi:hypothetical protein